MERWDIYDGQRQKLGYSRAEDDRLKKDEYRLVVHGIIINSRNEMLIQKRSQEKEIMGGYWDLSWAGSVQENEKSLEGLRRELKEELGIFLSLDKRPDFTVNFENGFDDFFIFRRDLDLAEISLDKKEVEDVMWMDFPAIIKLIERGEFIPYQESFIKLLFDISKTGEIYSEGLF